MKSSNQEQGLLAKVVANAGDKLANIPIDPFSCWAFTAYEPELSDEMIHQMVYK
jgi:hypothetical protein